MENKGKIWKIFACIAGGAILGYLIYYFIFMDLIPFFISTGGMSYYVISILCLILCIFGCIAVLSVIINRRINKTVFAVICVAYFLVLFSVLFLRKYIERVFVWNPITGLVDTFSSFQMLMQSIMNFVIFIPIGYFIKKWSYLKVFVFSILVPILIEVIQVLLMRGFFDTFDIILYFAGINIGYLIFRKIKITIQ